MRRIYESRALHRSDDDPFSPNEDDDGRRSHVDWQALSHALLPVRARHRALAVTVETPREVYAPGEDVPFRVTLENRWSMPVTVRTETPLRWQWAVDGHPEASHVALQDPPDERTLFEFHRRERKRFERTWPGKFRTGRRAWERAEPGEYELSAWVCVEDPAGAGLRDSVTVRVE